MRFPRQVKIFRGQFDAAPFAGVFFLLLLFLLLHSSLVFPPGIPIQLPQSADLPGTELPTIVVAVDAAGQLYFKNQIIAESDLQRELSQLNAKADEPLTLVIQADRNVVYERLIRLGQLAETAGIQTALLATRPPPTPIPAPLRLP